MLFLSLVSLGIISFQWFFIGYSLVFSETGGSFWGDGRSVSILTFKAVAMLTQAHHRNVGFRQVLERPIPESNGKLPEIVFATFQLVSHAIVIEGTMLISTRCSLALFQQSCLALQLSEAEYCLL